MTRFTRGRKCGAAPRDSAAAGGDPLVEDPVPVGPGGQPVRERLQEELLTIWRQTGKTIIFITHKLNEVLEVADTITVLRRGKVVGTVTPKETDPKGLAEMMVGREVQLTVERGKAKVGAVALSLEKVNVLNAVGEAAGGKGDHQCHRLRGVLLRVGRISGQAQRHKRGGHRAELHRRSLPRPAHHSGKFPRVRSEMSQRGAGDNSQPTMPNSVWEAKH